MGSGERKRCSNMAPVRRLRNFAWMKARKFPGVRCSTLNTECRSLLCLMIMPGRSWVAGMAMDKLLSLHYLRLAEGTCSHIAGRAKVCILYGLFEFGNQPSFARRGNPAVPLEQKNTARPFRQLKCSSRNPSLKFPDEVHPCEKADTNLRVAATLEQQSLSC